MGVSTVEIVRGGEGGRRAAEDGFVGLVKLSLEVAFIDGSLMTASCSYIQDLMALGIGNLISSFFSTFVASGSFSKYG